MALVAAAVVEAQAVNWVLDLSNEAKEALFDSSEIPLDFLRLFVGLYLGGRLKASFVFGLSSWTLLRDTLPVATIVAAYKALSSGKQDTTTRRLRLRVMLGSFAVQQAVFLLERKFAPSDLSEHTDLKRKLTIDSPQGRIESPEIFASARKAVAAVFHLGAVAARDFFSEFLGDGKKIAAALDPQEVLRACGVSIKTAVLFLPTTKKDWDEYCVEVEPTVWAQLHSLAYPSGAVAEFNRFEALTLLFYHLQEGAESGGLGQGVLSSVERLGRPVNRLKNLLTTSQVTRFRAALALAKQSLS